jgi:hypothetical protein
MLFATVREHSVSDLIDFIFTFSHCVSSRVDSVRAGLFWSGVLSMVDSVRAIRTSAPTTMHCTTPWVLLGRATVTGSWSNSPAL